jgi:hypothetical protein
VSPATSRTLWFVDRVGAYDKFARIWQHSLTLFGTRGVAIEMQQDQLRMLFSHSTPTPE